MKELNKKIKNIKKEQIIIFVLGLIIGITIMLILYPKRIAKLKNGEEVAINVAKTKITADKVYETLKEKNALNSIIEVIDKTILDKKYELSDEDYKTIDETAKNYIQTYNTYYNMTEEEFLSKNGFANYDEFKSYLELDYKRTKFYKEYLTKEITNEETEKYYNEKVYGSIKTEHILVKISETLEDESAKAKAEEILNKLHSGTSWNDVKSEYKDVIVTESVTVDFDSNLESEYMKGTTSLKDGEISNSLVKTSYGYHIINRISSEEKKDIKSLTDRIKTMIIKDKETEDKNLYEKVMIKMREEASLDIKDTELKKVYNKYLEQNN